ncbi:MAG: MFS transporter [Oligoflexia bacterium]|nr:MFS transporter [Oligoflexia bacterium]
MQRQAQLQANIWRAYALRTMQFFWFSIPTYAIFLGSYGLGFAELMQLKAMTSFGGLLMETPSGYFADKYGRRLSIVIGMTACAIGTAIYILSGNFWDFMLAELLLGTGISFVSGADSALVFDSLKELTEENRYGAVEGRLSALSGYAEAIGGLVGAALAAVNVVLPFALQFIMFSAGVGLSLLLCEPRVCDSGKKMKSWKDLRAVMFKTLWGRLDLRCLIYASSIIGVGTYATVFFAQMYMQQISLPVPYFGVAWAVFHVALGTASIFAEGIDQRLGCRAVLRYMAIILALSYFALGALNSVFALLFVVLIYCVRGLRQPLIRKWINALSVSEERATVISTHNFLTRLGFVVLGPLLGICVERYSIGHTLSGFGLLVGTGAMLCVWLLERESEPHAK